MPIDYGRIGFNIKQCRKRAGLTQRVLAEKIGCTAEHFSHIEKGDRRVQLEMLIAICENLHVSIEEILENALAVEICRKTDDDDSKNRIQEEMFHNLICGMSSEKAAALMDICQSILSMPRY